MAKARIGLKLDRSGIADIVNGQSMKSFLQETSQDIADSAGSVYEARVDIDRRKSRPVGIVLDPRKGAMFIEAKYGTLSRAITSHTEGWTK